MNLLLPDWMILVLVFGSVGLLTHVAATTLVERRRVRERYSAANLSSNANAQSLPSRESQSPFGLQADHLGLDAKAQRVLRMSLMRAGYFSQNAVVVYTIIRIACVILVPLSAYLIVQAKFGHWNSLVKLLVVAASFVFSYYVTQAYLDRRQRLLEARYRLFFPEFLDMLVVCVGAGLSLEAALERVSQELGTDQRAFSTNLQLMMAEMRAGKTTIDALKQCADRLGLAEANSLVTLLQQSLELGTDISASISTYSEEMREKRLSRAEEKAMALPVKLTMPLALFILPTVFIAILTPAVMKITTTLARQ